MTPRSLIALVVVATAAAAVGASNAQPRRIGPTTTGSRRRAFRLPRRGSRARDTSASTCSRRPGLSHAGAHAAPPVRSSARSHTDYTVSKVYFESLPGFFVTGNLYRPVGDGPFPAILSPHGHWTYGRLENTALNSGPGRAIGLARQGFVVFTHDMVGYNDSRQLPHTFGGRARTCGA